MDVAIFLGQTLTVAGVTAGVTQILKVTENLHPFVKKVPVIGPMLDWLIDTITPEDPGAIQIFVGILCFGLNILAAYMRDGYVEVNLLLWGQTLASFLQASGGYVVILKRFQAVPTVAAPAA